MSEKAKKEEEDFTFSCPSCANGTIQIKKSIYDLKDGDQMLILKYECNKCKFSKSDIIPLSTQMEPGVITLKITDKKDLDSKIYRSPSGYMEIPELDLEVEPGRASYFYFTNVEGILVRFKEAVEMFKRSLDQNDDAHAKVDKILSNIDKAINGEFSFTLKITDLQGGSYIIPVDESKYAFEKRDYEESDFKLVRE